MDFEDGVANLISYLETGHDVPIQVGGTGGRPIPSITVDDLDHEPWTPHHTTLEGANREGGVEVGRVNRHYYTLSITLMATHEDQLGAARLYDKLLQNLDRLTDRPRTLYHPDVRSASVGGGGGVSHQFNVPTEHEYVETLEVNTFRTETDGDFDTLATISQNITSE